MRYILDLRNTDHHPWVPHGEARGQSAYVVKDYRSWLAFLVERDHRLWIRVGAPCV